MKAVTQQNDHFIETLHANSYYLHKHYDPVWLSHIYSNNPHLCDDNCAEITLVFSIGICDATRPAYSAL